MPVEQASETPELSDDAMLSENSHSRHDVKVGGRPGETKSNLAKSEESDKPVDDAVPNDVSMPIGAFALDRAGRGSCITSLPVPN